MIRCAHGVPRPVAEQLGQLIDLVVRDFIMNWYGGLTDDMTFINDGKAVSGETCRGALTRVLC